MAKYLDYGFQGRVAEPIDIARAALFFAQENLFITGQTVIIDGGGHM